MTGEDYIMGSFMICTAHQIYSGDQIMKNEMGSVGDKRGAYRVLVWRPDGKRPFGRYKTRWEENIKMDLQEVEWCCVWLRIGTGGERL